MVTLRYESGKNRFNLYFGVFWTFEKLIMRTILRATEHLLLYGITHMPPDIGECDSLLPQAGWNSIYLLNLLYLFTLSDGRLS